MPDPIPPDNGQPDAGLSTAFSDSFAAQQAAQPPAPPTQPPAPAPAPVSAPPPVSAPAPPQEPPPQQTFGPPSTTTTMPPVEAPPAPAPEPQGISGELAKSATDAGIDVSQYKTQSELAEAMVGALQQAQPYVNYARQMAPHAQEFQDYLRQQQTTPPPQQAAPVSGQDSEDEWNEDKHFSEKWTKPEYDPTWETFVNTGMIVQDQNSGQYIPSSDYPMAPANVVQGLNDHRNWQRDALQKMMENPYQSNWDAIQEPLERMVDQRVRDMLHGYDDRNWIQQFENQYAEHFYQRDASGQYIQDPASGQWSTTPLGSAFYSEVDELRSSGMRDPQQIAQKALGYAVGQAAYNSQAPPAQDPNDQAPAQAPVQAPAQPTQPPVETQDPRKTFMDKAMQRAAHTASSSGYGTATPAGEPEQIQQSDLENMFSNDWRKHAATT